MKHIILLVFMFACSAGGSEKRSEPLAIFELNKEYEYLSGLGADRIIMKLTKTDDHQLKYSIELMKNYYGLPLDYGTVTIKRVDQDSTINLEGGNDECQVKLRMYQSREPSAGKRIIIERTCGDTIKNITATDFQPLWRRGEAH